MENKVREHARKLLEKRIKKPFFDVRLNVDKNETFLSSGVQPVLMIESKGHAVQVFVNHEFQASAYGSSGNLSFSLQAPITLKGGRNEIALLSMTVGLQNAGPFYEWVGAGAISVKISGFGNGILDLSQSTWTYKIGLEGEHRNIFQGHAENNSPWTSVSEPPKNQPITWYKVSVNPPSGNEPVAIDMQSMGKGQVWLNGKAIGRYWPRTSSIYDQCTSHCDYRGKFFPDKCKTGCGEPTQKWYHVPRSWFQPSGNVLVIFEEKGGDPTKITFLKRRVSSICGFMREDYPSMDLESWNMSTQSHVRNKPLMHLKCPEGTSISSVKFASYGNPGGTCQAYHQGSCHHPGSTTVVEKACLRRNGCAISLSEDSFDKDLCPGMTKALAVEAACS